MDADNVGAAVIVIGPDQHDLGRDVLRGVGWQQHLWVFDVLGDRFIALVAPTRERIARKAPLVIATDDVEALVRSACTMLDDVTCMWAYALSDDDRQRAERIARADAYPTH